MTDLITAEDAKKLLHGATPGPWLYRPHQFDDWGVVRGGILNPEWGGYPHLAQVRDPKKTSEDILSAHRASGKDPWEANARLTAAAPDLARTVIALHTQLADAQTAQAMAVGRCAEEAVRTTAADGQRNIKDQWRAEIGEEVASAIRDLAPIDGLALVRELRAERDAASAVAATAYGASLDWEQILKDDALWQAQDDIAKSRVACMAAEADRDRLAAANAALEAKVAGLREAVDEQTKARAQHWLRRTMTAPEDAEVEALCERCGYGAVMDAASRLWARKPHGSGAFYIGGCIGFKSDEEARAALATQEAGNAQSTPPISPEEAQFNAVRHHERFGPLDEKGNPLDPRRRG